MGTCDDAWVLLWIGAYLCDAACCGWHGHWGERNNVGSRCKKRDWGCGTGLEGIINERDVGGGMAIGKNVKL